MKAPPKIRSAIKPFVLPPVKPKIVPPKLAPQTVLQATEAKPKVATPEGPPAKPKQVLAPVTVSVYLRVASEPAKEGLGAVFLLDSRRGGDVPKEHGASW